MLHVPGKQPALGPMFWMKDILGKAVVQTGSSSFHTNWNFLLFFTWCLPVSQLWYTIAYSVIVLHPAPYQILIAIRLNLPVLGFLVWEISWIHKERCQISLLPSHFLLILLTNLSLKICAYPHSRLRGLYMLQRLSLTS